MSQFVTVREVVCT